MKERETAALLRLLHEYPDRGSSVLARVEVLRAIERAEAGRAATRRAVELLDRVLLLEVTRPILDAAATAKPATLRSLDALHLATAMTLGDDLVSLISYDRRLIEAAGLARLPVQSPR